MVLEIRRRKAGKNGVVTTLGMPEGQVVTVVRVDARTEIVSLEPEDRVREMVAALRRPQGGRHSELMERLRGESRAEEPLTRGRHLGREQDVPTTEGEADLFASRLRVRRPF
jgi:hypothetical protein